MRFSQRHRSTRLARAPAGFGHGVRRLVMAALLMLWVVDALPARAEIGEHVLRLSCGDAEDSPGPTATRRFAELVAKASRGRIKVKTYHSAMLGNDLQIQASLRSGTVEMALVGAPTLGSQVKEFGVLDLPYSIRTAAEADALLDGPMGGKLLDKLQAQGLVGLAFWEIGFRQITNGRRPVTRWEDIAGLKIRTVQSAVAREFFDSLGASATPMPITKVYAALETKAIDAQENPPSIISTQKFFEVQKYLSVTNHIYTAYVLLMSAKTWEKLNADERKLITDAAAQARTYERQLAREKNAALLDELRGQMTVNELGPAELARITEKAVALRSRLSASLGEGFTHQWFDAIDKVRAGSK